MFETVVKRVLHHIAARWEKDSQRKTERECVFQNMRRTGWLQTQTKLETWRLSSQCDDKQYLDLRPALLSLSY